MNQAELELHPEAVTEARAARAWYAVRSPSAAAAFIAELDHAILQITEATNRWPSYLHGTRRYLLRRFPFSVVYRVSESKIHVVAVAHARRRPAYWRER